MSGRPQVTTLLELIQSHHCNFPCFPPTPSPQRASLFQRITAEIDKIFVGQSELVLGHAW